MYVLVYVRRNGLLTLLGTPRTTLEAEAAVRSYSHMNLKGYYYLVEINGNGATRLSHTYAYIPSYERDDRTPYAWTPCMNVLQ